MKQTESAHGKEAPTHSLREFPSPASGGGSGRGPASSTPRNFYAAMAEKLRRLVEAQLGYFEARLDPLAVLDNPRGTRLLRRASEIMTLWRRCEHAACRRAQVCRREPRHCVSRYARFVPPEICARVGPKLREEYSFSPRAGRGEMHRSSPSKQNARPFRAGRSALLAARS